MDRPIVALVLAGGTGTRLYPATRSDRPKQFRSFGAADGTGEDPVSGDGPAGEDGPGDGRGGSGDGSLLARTVERTDFADETYVLTRPAFVDGVRERAPEATVLTEPEPRDTGPALCYAAAAVRERVGDAVMVCLPSDHRVGAGFADALERAARVAADTDGLVTVGIEPTRPAPGYGYVEPGDCRDGHATVVRFHEKPDRELAAEYVDRGWYWNAGVFAWTPTALLRETREGPLGPLVDALERGDAAAGFAAVDPISVDHAVMERTDDAYVVPTGADWDDLGTWDAVGRHAPRRDGNAVLGDALAVDATDNVVATDGHVSLVGVSDLVVASYGDRTLVVPRDRSGDVRTVVDRLRERDLF